MAEVTPMMKQYLQVKEEYPDCILFFRLGDFYEMFFEDAEIASKVLDIVLTGKACGLEERAPMCGVPYHAVDAYVKPLIEHGYKVAICEQLTDPALSKGIVERGVVRIITPGTVIEDNIIEKEKNNYILSFVLASDRAGVAYCDVSTGEFFLDQEKIQKPEDILPTLMQVAPSEVITNDASFLQLAEPLNTHAFGMVSCYGNWAFEEKKAKDCLKGHFGIAALDELEDAGLDIACCAAGGLMQYLMETQKVDLVHINRIQRTKEHEFLEMDTNTRRNLELTKQIGGSKKGTLLWVLDRTKTSGGTRMLRRFIEFPLQDPSKIQARLEGVEELVNNFQVRDTLRELLDSTYDIERLCSKVSYGTLNGRDARAISKTLSVLPELKKFLLGCNSGILQELGEQLDTLEDLYQQIEQAIVEDPPISVREGGLIRRGYDAKVDEYQNASTQGKQWLLGLEEREKEETGIKNLKIGYNKVFGYYIEVTKSQYSLVPYRYVRKQTLANAERYITEELKQLEDTIVGAEDKCIKLEYLLFCELRDRIKDKLRELQVAAHTLALTDVLQSLATCAYENGYVRPQINQEGRIHILEGRHPVVERTSKDFVPNNTEMDEEENRFLIITGPNMSGKSTYMRQVAIITLMAHIGSFVPAREADICIVDRIFTRVGASDDLASGRSTFMVEMVETATILNSATKHSLIILDEIGRGTSTFDGLSIAWATSEYIANKETLGAKSLFATHYHELSELEGVLEGVKNYCILAKEVGDEIIFLHRIVRGGTDKSFGIQVAKLAGVPKDVTTRASEILEQLRSVEVDRHILGAKDDKQDVQTAQMGLFGGMDYKTEEIIEALKQVDVSTMTPLDALNRLNELKDKAARI